MMRRMTGHFSALFFRIFAVLMMTTGSLALAAVPGLPFSEDFIDKALCDASRTQANWDPAEQALVLAGRHPLYDVFGFGTTGADITADAHATNSIALGDVDGDGDLDVVAGNFVQANRLYLNNGTSTPFQGVTGSDITSDKYSTIAITLGDVDGDGDLDVVTGNWGKINRLYLNNGTSDPFNRVTGTDISTDAHNTYSVALGDVDGDGDLDLVAGNVGQRNRLYLNNGTSAPFDGVSGTDVTTDSYNTYGIALGDVDGDGALDLVTGNVSHANRLYLNNGTSAPFNGVTGKDITADVSNTQSIALGDMDGDGDLDVVAGNWMSAKRLYLNDGSADPFNSVTGKDIGTGFDMTWSVAVGDVDGDGDLDLVTGNDTDANRLYLNNGSADPFFGVIRSDITADSSNVRSVMLGDMDGDGSLDLVVGNSGQANRLYLNLGTSSPFQGVTGSDITSDSLGTTAVAVGDVDGDGDLDVVAGNFIQPNRLYLNNGTSTPFNGVIGSDITTDKHSTTAIALGDVDGDGDLDVVTGNWGKINRLYLNNGTSTPFNGVTGSNISTDAHNTYSVALGDVDGDGDLDLVAGNVGQRSRLYLNNGTSAPFDGVSGTDVTTDSYSTYGIALGDVDGDGDLDLVAGNVSHANRLYLNNGTSAPFNGVTGKDITADVSNTQSIALGDMDGDGDLDVVAGNWMSAKRLYLNNGSADPFNSVTGKDIGTGFDMTWSVAVGDVDGDGALDLVTGNDQDANRLYLNNGSADPFSGVIGSDIPTDSSNVRSVMLGDMDGDGALDLVVGNSGQANRLYLNKASAVPLGCVTGTDVNSSYTTTSVALGDVDGDGSLDLVAGNNSQVNWLYLNNETSRPFNGVTGTGITTDSHMTSSVALGDVDGDGDLDLVAGNYGQVNRLYLNNGSAFPFNSVTGSDITTDAYGTWAIALGDVDGDGDLDLVTGNRNQASRLYLNNGTAAPFNGVAGSDVSADTYDTRSVALGDVDGDGDLDLVIGSSGQTNRLYLNNGSADPFGGVTGTDITADAHDTRSVALGDADGDGDLDLVAGNYAQTNRLYLNNGTSTPFNGVTGGDITTDAHPTLSVALGDMDGDGDLDLVAGNYAQTNRLYLNNGSSTPFSGVTGTDITSDAHNTFSVALGDVDGDGALDLVAGNSGQAHRLYQWKNYNTVQGRGVSLRVDAASTDVLSATLTATTSLFVNTRVDYWMSNTGGVKWFLVRSGESFAFPTSGHDLRWKAELASRSPILSPRVDQIDINGILAPTATATHTATPTATSTRTPTMTPTATATPAPSWRSPGWGSVDSNQPVSGLMVYGDRNVMEMGGLAVSVEKSKQHYLAHFDSSTRWYTGLAVANPGDAFLAHVTVAAYSNSGQTLGQAQQTIQPRAKMSALLSSLIGPNLGTGWIEVTSDQDVTASLVYGDQISGGLGALPSCPTGNSLILPHFVQSNRWWTGIAVVNVGTSPVDVTLTAYDAAGVLLDQKTQTLPSKNKILGYVESILPLAAGKSGWILVDSTSGTLAGMSIYGDKLAVPNRIGALPGIHATRDVLLSDFVEDSAWWTGVALVNPNGIAANVEMKAYAPDGSLIGTRNQALPGLSKVAGMVDGLFTLNGQTQGWVKVSSDVPVAGLEMLNADDATNQSWGLAAIEGQPSGYGLYYGHYTITAKWWTMFAIANQSGTSSANVQLRTYGDNGSLSAVTEKTIPANGRVADYLLQLLGL